MTDLILNLRGVADRVGDFRADQLPVALAQAMHRDTHYDPAIFGIDFSEPFLLGVVPGDASKNHIHYPQAIEPLLAQVVGQRHLRLGVEFLCGFKSGLGLAFVEHRERRQLVVAPFGLVEFVLVDVLAAGFQQGMAGQQTRLSGTANVAQNTAQSRAQLSAGACRPWWTCSACTCTPEPQ